MSSLGEKTVIAVDPGEKKCGVAVAKRQASGEVTCLLRAIVPRPDLPAFVGQQLTAFELKMVVVGNGTGSRKIVEELRDAWAWLSILVVDERETTLEARELYWLTKGRRGWRILLPSTLQVPPEPHDDFAALVLAHRVLSEA